MKWIVASGILTLTAIAVYGSLLYAAFAFKSMPEAASMELAAYSAQAPEGDLHVTFDNFEATAGQLPGALQETEGTLIVHSPVENTGRSILTCALSNGCPAALAPNGIWDPNTLQAAIEVVADNAVTEALIPLSPLCLPRRPPLESAASSARASHRRPKTTFQPTLSGP
jgi:hypothetical protein